MSVVVGIVANGRVYIGSDSQITSGGTKKSHHHPNNRKIWHPDRRVELLMGSVGQYKGINVVKSINGIIDQQTLLENSINYNYVYKHISRKIFEAMEEVKLIDSKDINPKMFNEFLFANNHELYSIGSDGSVIQIEDFVAIGSGSFEATGSLLSTEGEDPAKRVTKAIQAAIDSDIYVGYPIVIMNTENEDIEVGQEKT